MSIACSRNAFAAKAILDRGYSSSSRADVRMMDVSAQTDIPCSIEYVIRKQPDDQTETYNPQQQTSSLLVRMSHKTTKGTRTSKAKTSATPSRDFHPAISPIDQRDLALSIEATTRIGSFVERELKHCEMVCDTLSRSAVEWILGRTSV